MARRAISDEVQARVLLRSRRRCCLCFWLHGEDDVRKGQLAHLDGDNENSTEGNLAFLCLEHHDEYDSIPRLSKGLREREVKQWRDELYKEMEYRFRTEQRHAAELSIVRFVRTHDSNEYDYYCAQFRLRNTGNVEIRSPAVSLRLTNMLFGEPQWGPKVHTSLLSMHQVSSDLFEQSGRIATLAPAPILLRDHSIDFYGLSFNLGSRYAGTVLQVAYRIDGEGMAPSSGVLRPSLASKDDDLITIGRLVAEGVAKVDR